MKQSKVCKRVRIGAAVAAVLLLGIEILIGQFADGWVRAYLGDVLVVPLVYAVIRVITPCRPRFGVILPSAVLIFAFAVEFLQLIGIADILGVTNPFLRTIIGTSFAVGDLLCYAAGAVPLYVIEGLLRRAET
ncbi:MAG: DUF2809 domain-containing protein [Ruminiclostridium sp.]|nr:DUF2809 domain-containing protein [Ruminiclostridium sp.]